MNQNSGPSDKRQQRNIRVLGKLLVVVVLMFGFGWALIPIYNKICEITGINILARQDEGLKGARTGATVSSAELKNTQVDTSRVVTIELDANSQSSQSAWRFRPTKSSIDVHPGELTTVVYEVANQQGKTVVGQAIPSYMPLKAAEYFKKLECFCFQQQTLAANEVKSFPVVFVIDPKLPKDVNRITLSYTFFEVAGASKN
jgi:cytochrome c oxidase assembly protein subunit 11